MPTIIASQTTFQGHLHCEEECIIYGNFEGILWCSEAVIIAPEGFFKGTICAPTLVVQGRYEGNIECDKMKIYPLGHVIGKISSYLFIMHPKAIFEGQRVVAKHLFSESSSSKDMNELDTENILL